MGYLFGEIVLYLVGAGLIGFVFGWAVRDGVLDKYSDKFIGFIKEKFTKKEDVSVSNTSVVDTTSSTKETVIEVEKPKIEEVKTETPIEKKTAVESIENEVVEVETKPKIEKELKAPTLIEKVENKAEVDQPILLNEAPENGQDKLSAIKGIGPVLEKKLNELGVYTFEQIASWDTMQEQWVGSQMSFPKRVTKEEWVNQAKELLKSK